MAPPSPASSAASGVVWPVSSASHTNARARRAAKAASRTTPGMSGPSSRATSARGTGAWSASATTRASSVARVGRVEVVTGAVHRRPHARTGGEHGQVRGRWHGQVGAQPDERGERRVVLGAQPVDQRGGHPIHGSLCGTSGVGRGGSRGQARPPGSCGPHLAGRCPTASTRSASWPRRFRARSRRSGTSSSRWTRCPTSTRTR